MKAVNDLKHVFVVFCYPQYTDGASIVAVCESEETARHMVATGDYTYQYEESSFIPKTDPDSKSNE